MISPNEYTELREQGYENKEIAEMKNISYQIMRRQMKHMNVWKPYSRTKERYREYVELRSKEKHLYKIADQMGIHDTTLYQHRDKWGVVGDRPEDYQDDVHRKVGEVLNG